MGEPNSELDSVQKAAAVKAFSLWSEVANVSFSLDNTNYDIVLSEIDLPGSQKGLWVSDLEGDKAVDMDVFIDVNTAGFSELGVGSFTFLHEIGHAMGLKHPINI